MKKFRTLSNLWPSELSKGKGLLIITLGLGFAFWTATSGAEGQDQSKDKDKDGDKDKHKCIVCHNEHNFHEITIPCNKVDKYLRHHPGDHAGPCQVTSVTNP
jgi:hypothetical protein